MQRLVQPMTAVPHRLRAVALVLAVVVGVVAAPVATAQSVTGSGDAPLFAPVAVPAGADDPVALASLSVLGAAGGGTASVVVGFASSFTPPPGRWRVSVGVGDPAGEWVRTSMLWDGTAAVGEAVRLDGVLSSDLGAVDATVADDGTVTLGLPAAVVDGSAGDVMWAEAVLGDEGDPQSSTRSPWFSRSALFGDGVAGLVPGGIYGRVVGGPESPVGLGATDPAVVETGVPSVAEVSGNQLSVEVGSPPTTVDGGAVAAVLDIITMADGTRPFDQSPQVVVNMTLGLVDLQLAQPAGLPTLAGDGSWLVADLAGPVDPAASAPAIAVDINAAYAAFGLDPPGDDLVVSVTRLVRTAEDAEVVAAGVAARRAWLDQLAVPPLLPVPTVADAVAPVEPPGGPQVAIAIGVGIGVVAVAVAMVLAQARARRRPHPAVPSGAAPQTPAPLVWEPAPVAPPVDDPGGEPAWGVPAGGDAGGYPTTAGGAPHDPAGGPAPGGGAPVAAPGGDHTVAADGHADGVTGEVAGASAATPPAPATGALGAIDDDLADLARRLRRLDDDAS
jgi:hypothetical protein